MSNDLNLTAKEILRLISLKENTLGLPTIKIKQAKYLFLTINDSEKRETIAFTAIQTHHHEY